MSTSRHLFPAPNERGMTSAGPDWRLQNCRTWAYVLRKKDMGQRPRQKI
ncbi:MAG TPA: hypothetical protein VF735_05535 [Pyrinomonadaceae bacterium]